MELSELRNPREYYEEDELIDRARDPGWEPDQKILLQLEVGQKVSIFNIILPFINMILLLQLYNCHPGPTTRALFLCLFLTFFVSGLTSLWVYHCWERIRYSLRPNLTSTFVVFIASGALAIYFYGLFFRLMFYKDEHEAYLKGQYASPEIWTKLYGMHTLEEEMGMQNSKLNWSIPSSLILAVTLTYIAHITRKIYLIFSMRSYGLNKMLLIICGILTMALCWRMFLWAGDADYVASNMLLGFKLKKTAVGMMAITFLLMLIVTINVILAVKKHKKSYFVFVLIYSALCMLTVVLTISSIGYVRGYHMHQTGLIRDCKDFTTSIHESHLARVCPFGDKYLAPQVKCSKSEMTIRWEAGLEHHEVRTLNPSCCEMARYFYIAPQTKLSHDGVMLSLMLMVLVMVNYSLWKNSNSLFYIFSKPWETIGAIAVVGIYIGFLLHQLFKPSEISTQKYNMELLSYNSPMMFPSKDFNLVPTDLSNQFKGKMCHKYHIDHYPFPSVTEAVRGRPILRVAIMAFYGYVKIFSDAVNAGPKNSSRLLFPNCYADLQSQSLSSYKVIYGPVESVRQALTEAIFCTQNEFKDEAKIFYNFQYFLPDELDKDGLTHRENHKLTKAKPPKPEPHDTSKCLSTNPHFFPGHFGVQTSIKGRFVFKDPDTGELLGVHPDLKVTASQVFNNNQTSKLQQANTLILEDSIFIVSDIKRLLDFDYILRLHVHDPRKVYMNKTIDVLIPRAESGVLELSAGTIRLLTADGKRCDVEDSVCKTRRLLLSGSFKINFANKSITEQAYNGAQIMIFKDYGFIEPPIFNLTSSQRTWESKPFHYGPYTIAVLKAGYHPFIQRINLQSPISETITVSLNRAHSQHQMTLISQTLDKSVDFDLLVVMRGDKGRECTISPYNKYCGYGKYFSKQPQSAEQRDGVMLKNFAVATYAAYVAPAPSYATTCKGDFYSLSDPNLAKVDDKRPSWDWNTVRASKPMSSVPILGEIRYNEDLSPHDPNLMLKLRNFLPLKDPVESLDESLKARAIKSSYPKKMLNTSPLSTYIVNTDIRFTLENKGVVDNQKLRNWNVALTGALNAKDDEWANHNYTKLVETSSLNNQTVWPEIEDKAMISVVFNDTHSNKKEYDQNFTGGQKSHIIETNSSDSASNMTQWKHHAHTFRNKTHFPNNTSELYMNWWSAQIKKKGNRLISNTMETIRDQNTSANSSTHLRIFRSFERYDKQRGKREYYKVQNNRTGNDTQQSTVSKLVEEDTTLKMLKKTLKKCTQTESMSRLTQKQCHTEIYNSTSFSDYLSSNFDEETPLLRMFTFESNEKQKATGIVSAINKLEARVDDVRGASNFTNRFRRIDFDPKQNKNIKVQHSLESLFQNNVTGELTDMSKDTSSDYKGNDLERRNKFTTTTGDMKSQEYLTNLHYWKRVTLEDQKVQIRTKVDSKEYRSPTMDSTFTNKTIKNTDTKRNLSVRTAERSKEETRKYLGFKADYVFESEAAESKSGLSKFVSDTRVRRGAVYQPGTNVTKEVWNTTLNKQTSKSAGNWQTDYLKKASNQSRTFKTFLPNTNQSTSMIETMYTNPWHRSELEIKAKKICPQLSKTCTVDLKGSNQNITSDGIATTADYLVSESINRRKHKVSSQSLTLKHTNDTKSPSWNTGFFVDSITDKKNNTVQVAQAFNLDLTMPLNESLQILTSGETLPYCFGNPANYRTHSAHEKLFFRKYLHSAFKQSVNTNSFTSTSFGKVGEEVYRNELNISKSDVLMRNHDIITTFSMRNVTEGRAAPESRLENYNTTGTRLNSTFILEVNQTNRTAHNISLTKVTQYSNSTIVEFHPVISKLESAGTIEVSENRSIWKESRQLRKTVRYVQINRESEVLTTHVVEKNKLTEIYEYGFRVVVSNIDLNKAETDAARRTRLSLHEKKLQILPSGSIKVINEHIFPEDLKKEPPVLPLIPEMLDMTDIPTLVPKQAFQFQNNIFVLEDADMSTDNPKPITNFKRALKHRGRKALRHRRRRRAPRKLQAFSGVGLAESHLRTPQAAADARLKKLMSKLKTPSPTFSKHSVDSIFGVDRSNFFLIACFTGYGAPSVLQLNEYTIERPTPENCAKRLGASELKRYLVPNLQKEIDHFMEGHQDYVDQLNSNQENIFDVDSQDPLEITDFNPESI
jgi:hypothetical protein